MAFDLGGIGTSAFGWMSSIFTWIIIVGIVFLVFIGGLKFRQARRFQYPCIEITSLGQGKVSVITTKAGWFKKRKMFFGLIDNAGEQELICKDGKRKIFNASSVDYHEINGKRGLICKRKDDDPEVLVPLSAVEVHGLRLLTRIAPADYRDAAVDILEEKRKETMGWLEKNAPLLMGITIFAFGIIALIIIFNFAKGESAAWREYAMAAKSGAQIIASEIAP